MIASLCLLLPIEETLAADLVIQPLAKAGPLDNPLKGWCPYTDAGEIHQPYSMVFQYISWRELEPVKGDYRFEEWEKAWDVKAAQGKHIIFRVYVDYPSLPSGLPDWLRKTGVKETAYTEHGGGQSPDYDDPRMIAAMEKLIGALGKRYNKHPRIAFIQLGLLGFWGEWHTWPREKLYASPETEQRIIQAYRKAFPDKSLMVRYASNFAGQQEWIGFHDDMFPQDTDNGEDWSFLAGVRKSNRTENWKVAVVGGEMVPNKARQWIGKDFDTTLTMLSRSHFTWIGPYCPALEKSKSEQYSKNCEELIQKMGYEFQITRLIHPAQLKANQAAQFTLEVKNQGVAPFYYPWSIEWALLDNQGKVVEIQETDWDLRSWQPGSFSEKSDFTFSSPPGSYELAIGIRDPWQDRPAIRFANDLPVNDGWTIISKVTLAD
ncbi:hypothetical protein Pan54_42720 [Rubinisphaera italica]|uniref:DUF4832 domain-containing protein n=2 Tax=Rubinisphaera italica TaxID=2527969 RepID=A0A5C5XLU2_9PLAN|nr:hypothetical protein Pan54_42720 [Rubinisphaera italica]